MTSALFYMACLSQVRFVFEGPKRTLSKQSQRHVCETFQMNNILQHKESARSAHGRDNNLHTPL